MYRSKVAPPPAAPSRGNKLPFPGGTKQRLAIGTLPLAAQEACVIEDLLYVMVGISGKYLIICDDNGRITFEIDDSLDPSLCELVQKMLPVCRSYLVVDNYVVSSGSPDMGMVHHALCGAIRDIIKEYLILVAQLEHQLKIGALSLHRMWFYVQEGLDTLSRLETFVSTIVQEKLRGAQVLSLLHERATTAVSDGSGRSLWKHLATRACQPFFDTLEQWIYCGKIVDPYQEFFVVGDPDMDKDGSLENFNDAYWEKKFTVAEDRVPAFFSQLVTKVLDTGKYLRVLQECRNSIKLPAPQVLVYATSPRDYVPYVDKAYKVASSMLLDMLRKEKNLLLHLRSLKLYYLHGRSDIFQGFFDMAGSELSKPKTHIGRLSSLLELALRTSSARNDPNKDCLRAVLEENSLTGAMAANQKSNSPTTSRNQLDGDIDTSLLNGYDVFSLEYQVGWPVSLVANRRALTTYAILFRHLLKCKTVERSLAATWNSGSLTKRESFTETLTTFSLRHRMLHFLQNLLYYYSSEVIHQNWGVLEQQIREAETVDGVLASHETFLALCLKEFMMSRLDLFQIMYKMINMCAKLAETLESINASLDKSASVNSTDMQSVITLDRDFTAAMKSLIKILKFCAVSETEHRLTGLVLRLTFNGFYTPEDRIL